jgi:hypothetical protein
MTKKDLLKALEQYPDDTEIRIWDWTSSGSKYYLTNPTLTNNPTSHPERFDLSRAYEVRNDMRETTINLPEASN